MANIIVLASTGPACVCVCTFHFNPKCAQAFGPPGRRASCPVCTDIPEENVLESLYYPSSFVCTLRMRSGFTTRGTRKDVRFVLMFSFAHRFLQGPLYRSNGMMKRQRDFLLTFALGGLGDVWHTGRIRKRSRSGCVCLEKHLFVFF